MFEINRRAFFGVAAALALVSPATANTEDGRDRHQSNGAGRVTVRRGRSSAYSFKELFSMPKSRLRALAREAAFIDNPDPEKNVLIEGLDQEASWRFFEAISFGADRHLRPIVLRVLGKSFDAARAAQIKRELRDLTQRSAALSDERERIERQDKFAWRIRANQIDKERADLQRIGLFLAIWEEGF